MKMRGMLLLLLCVCSFLASANNSNQSTVDVTYSGQSSELITLERILAETRYRAEEYEGTCTRQIPYTEYECNDVTSYREECHHVPGENECSTVYERECNYETRYRQECHNGPSRRVCTNGPGRRVCRQGPAQEVCHVMNGRRVCRTKPGRQVCHTQPGREVCRMEPGRRVCSSQPYQDYVCNNVPRRQCDWIPAHNVCSDVPYTDNVCGDVTHYRAEDYVCTQTRQIPYVFDKKVSVKVELGFQKDSEESSPMTISFAINDDGELVSTIQQQDQIPYFVTKSEDINRHDSGDEVEIEGTIDLSLFNKSAILSLVNTKVKVVSFNSSKLVFSLGQSHDLATETISLELIRQRRVLNDYTLINRTLNKQEYKLETSNDGQTQLIIDLQQFNINVKDKSHKIKLDIALDLDESVPSEQRRFTKHSEFTKRP